MFGSSAVKVSQIFFNLLAAIDEGYVYQNRYRSAVSSLSQLPDTVLADFGIARSQLRGIAAVAATSNISCEEALHRFAAAPLAPISQESHSEARSTLAKVGAPLQKAAISVGRTSGAAWLDPASQGAFAASAKVMTALVMVGIVAFLIG